MSPGRQIAYAGLRLVTAVTGLVFVVSGDWEVATILFAVCAAIASTELDEWRKLAKR